MYECLTDYAFFDKYEAVCKEAKLNAMVEGSYTVKSCQDQANLLLKNKKDEQSLVQIQEDKELTINDIAEKLCDIAQRCEDDDDYDCEMSSHFIYYLLP